MVIPQLSPWLNAQWLVGFDPAVVGQTLVLLGPVNPWIYDTAVWSLVHEMRLSLMFPGLMWLMARQDKRVLAWGAAIALLPGLLDTYFLSFGLTVFYGSFFVLGAFMARHRARLESTIRLMPAQRRWLMLIASLLAYSHAFWFPPVPFADVAAFQDLATSIGSAGLIALAIGWPRLDASLSVLPLRSLGRISYSLYLIHIPVELTLIHALFGKAPFSVICVLVAIGSVAAATTLYVLVERPSIALAKSAERRIDGWRRGAPTAYDSVHSECAAGTAA